MGWRTYALVLLVFMSLAHVGDEGDILAVGCGELDGLLAVLPPFGSGTGFHSGGVG